MELWLVLLRILQAGWLAQRLLGENKQRCQRLSDGSAVQPFTLTCGGSGNEDGILAV